MNFGLKIAYLTATMLWIPYLFWHLFRAIKEMNITMIDIVVIIITAVCLLFGALRIYTAITYDEFSVVRYTIGYCQEDPDNQCITNLKTIFSTQ